MESFSLIFWYSTEHKEHVVYKFFLAVHVTSRQEFVGNRFELECRFMQEYVYNVEDKEDVYSNFSNNLLTQSSISPPLFFGHSSSPQWPQRSFALRAFRIISRQMSCRAFDIASRSVGNSRILRLLSRNWANKAQIMPQLTLSSLCWCACNANCCCQSSVP